MFTVRSPSGVGCLSLSPNCRSGCGSSRKPANHQELESSRLLNLQIANGICKITQFNQIQFRLNSASTLWLQQPISGIKYLSAQLVHMTRDIYIFALGEAIFLNFGQPQSLLNFSLFKFASLSFHRKLAFNFAENLIISFSPNCIEA